MSRLIQDAAVPPEKTPKAAVALTGTTYSSKEHLASLQLAPAKSTQPAAETTVDCYEFWDCVFRRAGVVDYTEGFYHDDPTLDYEDAQRRQIDFLLDEADCGPGSRLLDIGCGNGKLLKQARDRGALAVGVTISPHQVAYCCQQGLDVRQLNYRDLDGKWAATFDAVIANGSIEHFVQPDDAVQGRADEIYGRFFSICHHLIDPNSNSRKLVNTTIHFDRFQPALADVGRRPWTLPWFSDRFHYALLVRGFGGHYPSLSQFERCANGLFRLLHERDATYDYYLTSEEWLRHGWRSLVSPKQWGRLLPFAFRRPRHAARMMFLLMVSQSWNWQFRGEHPPMKHLWQTWEMA